MYFKVVLTCVSPDIMFHQLTVRAARRSIESVGTSISTSRKLPRITYHSAHLFLNDKIEYSLHLVSQQRLKVHLRHYKICLYS